MFKTLTTKLASVKLEHVALLAMVALVALAAVPSTYAAPLLTTPTLSIDFTDMFTRAWDLVNSLWPVMSIGAGFTLAFGILGMIVSAISKAIKF